MSYDPGMVTIDDVRLKSKELQERFDLSLFGVFGSVARNEAMPQSDVDIYVDFNRSRMPMILDRYRGLTQTMEEMFGCSVQLLTPRMVRNPVLKRSIERDLILFHG